ncbi:threonine aldolase, partial [Phenoliferia sp. Uapishka_3]
MPSYRPTATTLPWKTSKITLYWEMISMALRQKWFAWRTHFPEWFSLNPSVLVGPKAHIDKARWFRKLFGGGVRQSGSLATAADYALTNHLPLLPHTHILASSFASSLDNLGVQLLLPVETNILWIGVSHLGFSLQQLIERAKLNAGITLAGSRLIIHFQVDESAIQDLLTVIKSMVEENKDRRNLALLDVEQNARYAKGSREGMKRPERPLRMDLAYGTH